MALRVHLVGGCKSVRIENKEGMEKWKNRKKKNSFPHLCLVGGKKVEGLKTFFVWFRRKMG